MSKLNQINTSDTTTQCDIIEITVKRLLQCPICDGHGDMPGFKSGEELSTFKCVGCDGTGIFMGELNERNISKNP